MIFLEEFTETQNLPEPPAHEPLEADPDHDQIYFIRKLRANTAKLRKKNRIAQKTIWKRQKTRRQPEQLYF